MTFNFEKNNKWWDMDGVTLLWLAFIFFFTLVSGILIAFADEIVTVNTTISDGTSHGNAVNNIGYASNDTAIAAQSFTTVAGGAATSSIIALQRDGASPVDNVVLAIQADSGGSPSGTDLIVSSAIAGTALPLKSSTCFVDAPARTLFTFSGAPTLSASTKYWMVVRRTGSYDTSNNFRYCGDTTTDNGAVLKASTVNTTTWSTHTTQSGVLVVNLSSGGGGGGGTTITAATSSVDQTEQNLFDSYWSFLATVFFVVWLIRPNRHG